MAKFAPRAAAHLSAAGSSSRLSRMTTYSTPTCRSGLEQISLAAVTAERAHSRSSSCPPARIALKVEGETPSMERQILSRPAATRETARRLLRRSPLLWKPTQLCTGIHFLAWAMNFSRCGLSSGSPIPLSTKASRCTNASFRAAKVAGSRSPSAAPPLRFCFGHMTQFRLQRLVVSTNSLDGYSRNAGSVYDSPPLSTAHELVDILPESFGDHFGDILDSDFVRPLVLKSVPEHRHAKRAGDTDRIRLRPKSLHCPFPVDSCAALLLQPHPAAAGAAAEGTVQVAGEFSRCMAGDRGDRLARRLIDVVVPPEVAGVVEQDRAKVGDLPVQFQFPLFQQLIDQLRVVDDFELQAILAIIVLERREAMGAVGDNP